MSKVNVVTVMEKQTSESSNRIALTDGIGRHECSAKTFSATKISVSFVTVGNIVELADNLTGFERKFELNEQLCLRFIDEKIKNVELISSESKISVGAMNVVHIPFES